MNRHEKTVGSQLDQNQVSMPVSGSLVSLCMPRPDVSCFGCCPPIRPPHYDPLDYSRFLKREFAENRRCFLRLGPRNRSIVGFSCWALGFLDPQGNKIGCLLHPAQNQGEDLRYLVGYDAKCRRESCRPARVFAQLSEVAQTFWLESANGLNSILFSSRRANPLFHILNWGVTVLDQLHREALANGWTITELFSHRPFIITGNWRPQAHRWLFSLAFERKNRRQSSSLPLPQVCEKLLEEAYATAEALDSASNTTAPVFSHQLPMAEDFNDFIRLGLYRRKTTFEHACQIDLQIRRVLETIIP